MESGHRAVEHEPHMEEVRAAERMLASFVAGSVPSWGQRSDLVRALRVLVADEPGRTTSGTGGPEESGPAETVSTGRARKISVSMPEDLSDAVRERVGRGEFSRYVTEAVASRLEADLLAELVGLLDEEHGEVPEDLVAEAEGAWPDAE